MNQKRKIGKRIASWLLCMAMVLTSVNLPVFTAEVKAAEESVEAQAPSVTAFATKAELVDPNNFTLHTDNGEGVAQKVNFGSGKTWYIAGEDKDDTIVLMCDPEEENSFGLKSFLEYDKFNDALFRNSAEFGGLRVYISHYGISDVRKYLNTEVLNSFKEKEKELISNTVIYTDDIKNSCTFTTSDKLYLAYGAYTGGTKRTYITVGSNSSAEVNNGIKVGVISDNASEGSPYATCKRFWLRSPDPNVEDAEYYAMMAGGDLNSKYTLYMTLWVVPAFNMNLSSVLFASTATVASSDATLSDAMTFRMNGEEVIKSKAKVYYDGVEVTKGEASDEYLYIQYKDGEEDKVVSEKIEYDRIFNSSKYNLDTFENCKIWIEKYDEEANLAYAVMAENPNLVIDNNLIYEIVHNDVTGKDEATLIRFVRKYYQDASEVEAIIPSYVEKDGVKYTVTKIHSSAFGSNKKMTKVYIPDTVLEMEDGDYFHSCEILQTVRLSNNMNKLPANAFGFCKALATVNIPDTWDEIPSELFSYMSTLSDITISNSVKKVGANAFFNISAEGLEVTFIGTAEEWEILISDVNCAEGNDVLKTANVTCHIHSGGTATCTKKAICEDCGEEYGDVDTGNHDFSNQPYYAIDDKSQHYQKCKDCGATSTPVAHIETEVKNKKAATCTEKGYTGDKCCKDCGIIIEAGTEVNAKGHTEVVIPVKEATCKETGLTEGKICSVCSTITVAQTEVKKLDHTWDAGRVTKEPTKDATGEKTYTCTKCGETKVEVIDKLPDDIKPSPSPSPDPDKPTPDPTPVPSPEPVKPLVPEISVKGKFDVAAAVATVSDKKPVAYAITTGNKKAAKVTKAGILTANKAGELEITAYADKKKKEEITTVKLVIKDTKVPAKDTISFMDDICDLKSKITNLPLGIEVKFSISEKQQKIAIVDAKTGIITPVKDGKAKVTVEIGEGKNAAKFYTTITVKTPKFSSSKPIVIKTGNSKPLALKNVKSGDKITWSLSDKTKAEIIPGTKDSKIKVKGIAAGKVILTADVNGHKIIKEIEITE